MLLQVLIVYSYMYQDLPPTPIIFLATFKDSSINLHVVADGVGKNDDAPLTFVQTEILDGLQSTVHCRPAASTCNQTKFFDYWTARLNTGLSGSTVK